MTNGVHKKYAFSLFLVGPLSRTVVHVAPTDLYSVLNNSPSMRPSVFLFVF